jgi:transcriptional regulator with XRE-family HTH domain
VRDEDWDWDNLRANIVAGRVAVGMDTQEQLAEAIGISVRAVNSFENGKSQMRWSNLVKIAKAIGWEAKSLRIVLGGGNPVLADVRVASASKSGETTTHPISLLPDLSHLSLEDRREFLRQAMDRLPSVKEYFPALYDQAQDQIIELTRLYGGAGDDEERDRRSK